MAGVDQVADFETRPKSLFQDRDATREMTAPEMDMVAMKMKKCSAQARVVESFVEPQRHLGELERLRQVAVDGNERQRMHCIGVAGLVGVAVSQREVHCLHGYQRKQLGPSVVYAGRRIDEQIDDGPYLGGMGYRRIEQITDAAPSQVGGYGAKLRVRVRLDFFVRFGEGDAEQLQCLERKGDTLVVPAAGLIDLDAQAVDPGAVEIGVRNSQHQLEQTVCC